MNNRYGTTTITLLSMLFCFSSYGAPVKKGNNPQTQHTKDLIDLCSTDSFFGIDLDTVAKLIAEGADVNGLSVAGCTPLHFAVSMCKESKELCELLIKAGANLNAVENLGQTPLHYAILSGGKNCELLIESGANINMVNKRGQTPLHYAASAGQKTTCELLIKAGANVNAVDRDGDTALHSAAREGQKTIGELLLKAGANVNAINRFGETPLSLERTNNPQTQQTKDLIDFCSHLECRGSLEPAAKLIAEGADVNALLPVIIDRVSPRETLLHFAARRFKDLCELLIKAGANVDSVDRSGDTPLHYAARCGQKTICELLLKSGANVNAVDRNGSTPLHYAVENGQETTCELLLEAGANVNAVEEYGDTPLHYAVENGKKTICELLLKAGANVNVVDQSNNTIWLNLKRDLEEEEVFDLLFSYVIANIHAKAIGGLSALQYVASMGDRDLVDLLIQHGADIMALTDDGKTAADLARKNGQEKLGRYISKLISIKKVSTAK